MTARRSAKLSSTVAVLICVAMLQAPVGAASFQALGELPGGIFKSQAHAVSPDGSHVVGQSNTGHPPAFGQIETEAFLWTHTVKNLKRCRSGLGFPS